MITQQTVHKTNGKIESKFQDQTFFENFNWSNFTIGDVVWLEDYQGEVDIIAGVFVGYKNTNEPIVRVLPNKMSKILARNNSESILNYNHFWQKYLEFCLEDTPKHISQVTNKTAGYLAKVNLIDDWYHNNIKLSAQETPPNNIYGGQYASGNCWWY